jgi:hypothetical protein
MSAAELARNLDVPANRVTGILNCQRAITGDTALRLAHFFGTSEECWSICKVFMSFVCLAGRLKIMPLLDRIAVDPRFLLANP